MMSDKFKAQKAIVTGGTRGLGGAITALLLQHGATVVAVYGSNDQAAAAFKTAWNDFPVETVKLDVADYHAVEKFFADYDSRYESLDILVNSAGIRRDAVLGMMTFEDWNAVISTNLTGSFNMCKFAVHRMMQRRYGRIINITSPSGKIGFAGQSNYAASKAGQVALAQSLSKEVARRGITVNCVSPGFIDTELLADLSEDLRKEYKNQVPMKRFGTPGEVAATVDFLASKEASYVNGAVFEVTGGL